MNNQIILAGIALEKENNFKEKFEETKQLVKACNYEIAGEITQSRRSTHPATLFGSGKLEEIRELLLQSSADTLIISCNITPSQMKTLKDTLGVRVMDRTDLILEIFASRAKTKEAKLQVELATLKHRLPYVIRTGQAFSRMGGGSSAKNKGEGEKQLELDRRKIETQIQNCARELESVKNNRDTMRKRRKKSKLPMVALVGYTNAGKSTCMNALLKMNDVEENKQVFVKDMLFATLDTTVRKINWNHHEFLLSDTVGFVSDLPHELIKAFHSTLEEAVEADLILEVIDESDENHFEQMRVTKETLASLEVLDKPMLILHNKCDKKEFKKNEGNHFYISAANNKGLDAVLDKIIELTYADYEKMSILIPYQDAKLIGIIENEAIIHSCSHEENGFLYEIEIHKKQKALFEKYLCE